ncbi:MAG TPA: hypothetical protein P5081_21710 [Phycisphaerae bacterium]|nr:hypothetical protein [Phycisphaerae bacterium]
MIPSHFKIESKIGRSNGGSPRANKPRKIVRLVKVYDLLWRGGSRDDWEALEQASGVSKRTLLRDINCLRDAGVPVRYSTKQRTYKVDHIQMRTVNIAPGMLGKMLATTHAAAQLCDGDARSKLMNLISDLEGLRKKLDDDARGVVESSQAALSSELAGRRRML